MVDKPGRRWRETELAGKEKAERILLEMRKSPELSVDDVIKKLGLTAQRAAYQKAIQRWRKRINAEWAAEASSSWRGLDDVPGEEKQRHPLGPKHAGMVWQDGCWQDTEPLVTPNNAKEADLDAVRRNSGQYPRNPRKK